MWAENITFLPMSLFTPDDFKRFAAEHAPSRFVHSTPVEFNSFIKFLFVRDGYIVKETKGEQSQQDYFVCEREEYTLVVLPLLAVPGHEPDPQAIEKAGRLREFWQADFASIVTPGQFTVHTRKFAKKEGIDIWEWDQLYLAIRTLFFDGEEINVSSPMEWMEDTTSSDLDPELSLKVKWEPREGVDVTWFNLQLTITNNSDRHRYIHLDLPVIVDAAKTQIAASEWWEAHFKAGLIYAGASVTTNALFAVKDVGDKTPGGRVMLTCHEKIAFPVTYHLSAKLKGDACYVVTYCYGRQSKEYQKMISFRDSVLNRYAAGRLFIRMYYFLSPPVVYMLHNHPRVEGVISPFMRKILDRIIRVL